MAHAATSDRRSHLVMRRALSGLAPWIERLARLGFLARGLVYVLIGVLAIRVAFGLGRRYADAGGVLRVLLAEPFGRVLLVVVAAGLLGFAAWQAAAAIFDLERQGARFSGWLARVGYAVSAFVHLALGVDALRLVVATRPGRSIDPVHYWTVRALSAPHGTWLVAMVGAGVTVAGVPAIWLKAISLGAVCMGANTYIGNGPNFMVKAVAEEAGIPMPSFFGYMRYSCLILLPLFVGMTLVVF